MKGQRWGWLLIAVVLAVVWIPLLRPYQLLGHSTVGDIARGETFLAAVRGGDWTPRWLPDLYYRHGSPIFGFYAPLVYYLLAALRLLGLGGLWAPKIAFALGWTVAVWAVYRLAAEAIAPAGATAAATAFATAPYLLVDAYVRGGLAEFWGFGWLALALLGSHRAARSGERAAVLLAAIASAGLVLCHNITALIGVPLLAAVAIGSARHRRDLLRCATGLLLGLGLAAFFWLPALAEIDLVQARESLTTGHFDYRSHFHRLSELLWRSDAFTFAFGLDQRLPFAVGSLLWCGVLGSAAALVLPSWRRRLGDRVRTVAALLSCAVACVVMVLPVSQPLWRLPLLPFVQFPWRFLLPFSLLAATLLAVPVSLLPARLRGATTLLVALLAGAGAAPYLDVRYAFAPRRGTTLLEATASEAAILARDPRLLSVARRYRLPTLRRMGVTGTAGHDYLPRTVEVLPQRLPRVAAEGGEGVVVVAAGWGYPELWAEIVAGQDSRLVLNQHYFPGWQVTVDGRSVEARAEPGRGRIEVAVTAGRHHLEARFGDTPIRRAGKAVSGLAAILAMVFGWRSRPRSAATRI